MPKNQQNSLEAEMQRRGVTIYTVLKQLNKDPRSSWNFIAKKISGEKPFPFELLETVCSIITKESPLFPPLTPDNLILKKEMVKIL